MNTDVLEPLLEHLGRGDMSAARQVFLACAPYLRRVVRRRFPGKMQSKFDSADVVQSVWADLLGGYRAGVWHFDSVRRLQAFLVRVTCNRFHDKFRKHRIAFQREQPLAGLHTSEMPIAPEAEPRDVLAADDLWRRMLALCPPVHQELLRLKREGLTMADLVARTGLHAGSIRRVFRQLARRLALQQ